MKRSTHPQEECPTQGHPLTVFKLIAVIDGQRVSLSMGEPHVAVYEQNCVTYPPIPGSPLFAYRTLEIARQEYVRIKEINKHNHELDTIPIEIWMAETTKEFPRPDRIPFLRTYYLALIRRCGYGSRLEDGYVFFWENLSYSLKHLIGKRAGCKLDSSTVCCHDLMLLKQEAIQ